MKSNSVTLIAVDSVYGIIMHMIIKNNRGFTLIELLVVIAIIGILTAIVTANFATAKSKSRDAKRISDLAQLQLAMELFFDRCNRYPIVVNSMPKIDDGSTSTGCPTGITFAKFIAQIPPPPSPGVYEYGVNNATLPCIVASNGTLS